MMKNRRYKVGDYITQAPSILEGHEKIYSEEVVSVDGCFIETKPYHVYKKGCVIL